MIIGVDKNKVTIMLAERNMSARELGIKAGLGRATIYKILENGYCTTKTMHKIAKALKTPVSTLTNVEDLL